MQHNIAENSRITIFVLAVLILVLVSGCQTESAEPTQSLTATPTDDISVALEAFTPIPTVALSTSTPLPTATLIATNLPPTITSTATDTMTPIVTATAIPSPFSTDSLLPSITPTLERISHYVLQRPIAQNDDTVHWVDRTYPYGGTQFGTREVHLGVEFANQRFTPVFSAGEGRVLFAGDDRAIQFGPERNYYGNLVVIEHPFQSADGLPVYTLYAHLQDIEVREGDVLLVGQRIGRVGDTGIAEGPHLHFEVRAGDAYDYRTTYNPDLWIQPYPNFGTLAGRVTGIDNPAGVVLQVRSDNLQRETYTYGSDRVNSDPAWHENFTLGDLPAGQYEVIVNSGSGRNLFRETVDIISGETAFIEVDLSGN